MTDDAHLLFMACQRFEAGKAIRGAFLLTDFDTKPLEFHCTNPIRPTSLQTVLYGKMLDSHMMVDLIGLPLVNTLKQPPSLILVQEPNLLRLRQRLNMPVLWIARESAIAVGADGDGSDTAMLTSASGKFDPLVLIASKECGMDITVGTPLLSKVFNRFDLLEPFQRVLTALEQVHQQKIGESK
jgi:hypothetical protein